MSGFFTTFAYKRDLGWRNAAVSEGQPMRPVDAKTLMFYGCDGRGMN